MRQLNRGQEDMSLVFKQLEGDDVPLIDAYSCPQLRTTELEQHEFYELSQSQLEKFSNAIEVAVYVDNSDSLIY